MDSHCMSSAPLYAVKVRIHLYLHSLDTCAIIDVTRPPRHVHNCSAGLGHVTARELITLTLTLDFYTRVGWRGNHREAGDTCTRHLDLDIVRGIYTCRDGNHREILRHVLLHLHHALVHLPIVISFCQFSESNFMLRLLSLPFYQFLGLVILDLMASTHDYYFEAGPGPPHSHRNCALF